MTDEENSIYNIAAEVLIWNNIQCMVIPSENECICRCIISI